MTYIKVNDFERYSENPFVEDVLEDIEKHRKKRVRHVKTARTGIAKQAEFTVVQNSTGEQMAYGAFVELVELDEKQFAKFYVAELEKFYQINQSGRKVLSYIITRLKPNQDIVVLRMLECMEYTGYKHKKNVIDGIGNLIINGLLARAKYENEYYINPMVMFNGDRVVYAKMVVKRKKEEIKNQLGIFEQAAKEGE